MHLSTPKDDHRPRRRRIDPSDIICKRIDKSIIEPNDIGSLYMLTVLIGTPSSSSKVQQRAGWADRWTPRAVKNLVLGREARCPVKVPRPKQRATWQTARSKRRATWQTARAGRRSAAKLRYPAKAPESFGWTTGTVDFQSGFARRRRPGWDGQGGRPGMRASYAMRLQKKRYSFVCFCLRAIPVS